MDPPGPAFPMIDSHCPEYLIAFDASSTAIGFAYFVRNRLVDCGSVRSSRPTVQDRIVDLMRRIAACFRQPISKDVVCVMEWSEGRPMAFLKEKGRSAQSSVPLAHAQGALFWWLVSQGLDVVPVGESEWTKQKNRYRSKEVRAADIRLMYPEFENVWIADAKGAKWDAADAVGLGLWYINECAIKDAIDHDPNSKQTRLE